MRLRAEVQFQVSGLDVGRVRASMGSSEEVFAQLQPGVEEASGKINPNVAGRRAPGGPEVSMYNWNLNEWALKWMTMDPGDTIS